MFHLLIFQALLCSLLHLTSKIVFSDTLNSIVNFFIAFSNLSPVLNSVYMNSFICSTTGRNEVQDI